MTAFTVTDINGHAETVNAEDRRFHVATNLRTGRYVWDVKPMPELSGDNLTYDEARALFAKAVPETRRVNCAVEMGFRATGRCGTAFHIMAAVRNGRFEENEIIRRAAA